MSTAPQARPGREHRTMTRIVRERAGIGAHLTQEVVSP